MPKAGRPTAEPKRNWTCFRLSETDIQRIKYCAEKAGVTKAEAVRRGIEKFYNELSAHTKDEAI